LNETWGYQSNVPTRFASSISTSSWILAIDLTSGSTCLIVSECFNIVKTKGYSIPHASKGNKYFSAFFTMKDDGK
jgi:hypothetical protein